MGLNKSWWIHIVPSSLTFSVSFSDECSNIKYNIRLFRREICTFYSGAVGKHIPHITAPWSLIWTFTQVLAMHVSYASTWVSFQTHDSRWRTVAVNMCVSCSGLVSLQDVFPPCTQYSWNYLQPWLGWSSYWRWICILLIKDWMNKCWKLRGLWCCVWFIFEG